MTDTTRSANPFTWMLDVGTAIVAPVELDVAMDNAARRIGEAMDVSQVNIHAYDREADTLRSVAAWQAGGELDDFVAGRLQTEFKVSERPSWRPTLEGHIEEWHITDPDLPQEERALYESRQYKTTLDAPLWVGNEVIGTLGVVEKRHVRRFTPLEKQLFAHYCNMAAIGIRNARSLRLEHESERNVAALLAGIAALAAGDPTDDALATIAREARVALRASSCTVWQRSAKGGEPVRRVQSAADSDGAAGGGPTVAAPLRDGAVELGELTVAVGDPGRPYSADDRALLAAFANQAAIALLDERSHP